LCIRGTAEFWGQKKPFLRVGMDWGLQILALRRIRSTKSHIHGIYEILKRMSFYTKGYAEIHIQRPFFDNKNSI
jgi:hypothetical protein